VTPDTAQRIEAGAVAACLGGVSILPFFAPQGAHVLVLAASAAALGARWARLRALPLPLGPALVTGAFLVWCSLSLTWSAQPDASARWLGQVLSELPFGLALVALAATAPAAAAAAGGRALAFGVAAGSALALTDLLTGGAIYNLLRADEPFQPHAANRPLVIVSVLAWPAAALLIREGRPLAAFAVLGAPLPAMLVGSSATAVMAYAVGGLVWILAALAPVLAAAVLGVGCVLTVALAPLFALFAREAAPKLLVESFAPGTLLARLDIWRASARLILENPVVGQGLSAMRAQTFPEIAWLFAHQRLSHPHNAALQVWLDLGAVGALFLVVGLLAVLRLAARAPARPRPFLLAGFAALVASASTSWNIWAAWWIATLCAMVAAFALARRAAEASAEAPALAEEAPALRPGPPLPAREPRRAREGGGSEVPEHRPRPPARRSARPASRSSRPR